MFRTRPVLICQFALVLLMLLCSFANAELVINGSFELGQFASPGNSNYVVFAPGYVGTVIQPNQNILDSWQVSFSPFDPDQAISFPAPFGMEWTQGTLENARWIDLNRGGDLWQISQTISTTTGSQYELSYNMLVGNEMGGAVLRINIDGITSTVLQDIGTTLGGSRWERFVHTFTANSNSSLLRFMAMSPGIDLRSGPQIDRVSIIAVPEPSSWLLAFVGLSLAVGFGKSRRL